MLTALSLQMLTDISKSRLSLHVRHLHIALAAVCYPWLIRENPSGTITSGQAHRQIQTYTEQWILRSTGRDLDMLTEALRNLGNNNEIVISDTDSGSRSRDGPDGTRDSDESKRFVEQMDRPRAMPRAYVWDAVLTVLRAIAAAGADIKGLELVLHHHTMPWTGSLKIPENLRDTLAPVLKNLEKLHLFGGDAMRHGDSARPFSHILSTLGVRDFVSYTSNLGELRYNGTPAGASTTEAAFLQWLALPVGDEQALLACGTGPGNHWSDEEVEILRSSPRAVALPCLRILSLGSLALKACLVEKLIVKFSPTVRELELGDIFLQVRPDEELASPWKKLLVNLTNHEPPLIFHRLRFGSLGYFPMAVLRNEPTWPGRDLIDGPIEYSGLDWKGLLADIMERMNLAQNGESQYVL